MKVKKFAYRIYNVFRGPVGPIGQAGETGPKGDPGGTPIEYWEHLLAESVKANDRLRDRIVRLEQELADRGVL